MAGSSKRALGLLLLGLLGICAAAKPLHTSPERQRRDAGTIPSLALRACGGIPLHQPGPLTGRELYRRAVPGLAWALAADHGKGTAWLVDRQNRWLITNYHVVGTSKTVELLFPVFQSARPTSSANAGQPIADRDHYLQNRDELQRTGCLTSARVLQRDPDLDLALLQADRLPASATALSLASSPAQPSDQVWALGNRYDSNALWVLAGGRVRTCRTLKDGYFSAGKQLARGARVVEARVPVNEGDSGGPLLNDRGEVVGVTAAVAWENQGSGLFIDRSEVLALLAKVAGTLRVPSATAHGVCLLPSQDRNPDPRRNLYRQAVSSVVLVQGPGSPKRHSGFLLDRGRRLVVTTADAVGRKDTALLTFPAFRTGLVIADSSHYQERKLSLTGVVLARDPVRNLALVESPTLPAENEQVRLAGDYPCPGDLLHALGNADRISTLWLYSAGWLRQRGRAQLGQDRDDPEMPVLLVQLSPAEGEAGGPLLNDRGELVGILAGKSSPQQQIAYALPLAEIQSFLTANRGRWEPTRAGDWVERGLLFLKARLPDRAIGDFSEALRIDPDDARACSERSRAYQQKDELEQALADANRAIRLQPKLSSAYSQRAAVQVQRVRPREALADCETALQLDRNNAAAYRVRGESYRLLGDLERALADCSEAVWLDRKSAAGYLQRGRVYAARDELDRGLADYNQALALDPELAEAYRCRADLFWTRSDVQAAWTDYDQALSLQPADAAAWVGRGKAWSARKDSTRGLSDFRHALDLRPGLAQEVIAIVVSRARELEDGRNEDQQECCRLCRGTLQLLESLARGKTEAERLIREGLKSDEIEPAAQLRRLRSVLETVRQRWLRSDKVPR